MLVFQHFFFSSSVQAHHEIFDYCIIENQGQWDSSVLFFCPTSLGGIAFEKDSLVYLSIHHPPQRISLPYTTLSPKGVLPSPIQYTYLTSTIEIAPRTWNSILYRGIDNGIDYTFYLSPHSFMCTIQGPSSTHPSDCSFYTKYSHASLKKESQSFSLPCSFEFPMEDWFQSSDNVPARETVQAMHTNPLGISWVGGSVLSPTQSSLEESSNGNHFDAYIKKYHSDGTCAETIVFGGSGWEEVTGIDVSNDGQVYCCGVTDSSDFPAVENSLKKTKRINGGICIMVQPHKSDKEVLRH